MGKQTALYQKHLDAGARMIDFAGWDMPINYGSQIEEHNQVRLHAGVFDVSHMTVVDVSGGQARDFLRFLLANDVARLNEVGRALYSAMLNEEGGVLDDLIAYLMSYGYRLVVNCATRAKDLDWLSRKSLGYDVAITERPELAILAVHGPRSIDRVCEVIPIEWREKFWPSGISAESNYRGGWFIARTGYTGEKGLELIFPDTEAPQIWDKLLAAGVKPVGLGARDTLRLEAGMNLYGHDMDETISPLAANMEQTIAWEPENRDFIGRAAVAGHLKLREQNQFPILTGLVLETRGVLREGQRVISDEGEGVITSGSYSPTLKHSIALARIPPNSSSCEVELRGTPTPVRMVKPNFVRFGKKVFE